MLFADNCKKKEANVNNVFISAAELLVFDKLNIHHYGKGVQNLHLKLLQDYSKHCVSDICNPAPSNNKTVCAKPGPPPQLTSERCSASVCFSFCCHQVPAAAHTILRAALQLLQPVNMPSLSLDANL